MQLSSDIIRDVLLCIEKHIECVTTPSGHFMTKNNIHWKIIYEDEYLSQKYIEDDIKYCINKLREANMIEAKVLKGGKGISWIDIDDITWDGHKLLSSIRNEKLWDCVKKKLGGAAQFSILAFSNIVTTVGEGFIMQKLDLK